MFAVQVSVDVDSQSCGPETAVWSDYGEHGKLDGSAGTEAFVFAFPPLATPPPRIPRIPQRMLDRW
jgi:hypothetical protein